MKKRTIQIAFCAIIIVVISVMGILTLMNNNELSVKEGRKLNTFPEITLENLTTDEFYTNYTNAFADQLAFREDLIKGYYLVNLQRYTGDVVKGEDNQLFLSPLIIPDKKGYIKKLKNTVSKDMNNIAKEVSNAGAKFIFISIPRKDVIMEKYLPSSYIKGTEDYIEYVDIIKNNISKDIEFVDAYELFKNKQDEYYDVYYQTDHHLNIRGGYYIFENIISRVNKDGYNIKINNLEDEYDIYKRVINGSYNRKIGQSVAGKNEELVLVPKTTTLKYTRLDDKEESKAPIFGDGNTYAEAYMGGDYAETVVETNNDKAPNILYVGSSYTNVLESLSVYKFNKMVSIDYRDNKTGKSIADYVKEYNIDYVVFICAQSTSSLSVSSMREHLGLK